VKFETDFILSRKLTLLSKIVQRTVQNQKKTISM